MDYKKLLKQAGVEGDQADYIARKLKAKNVPKEKLNALGGYFPGTGHLSGVNLNELGAALYEAANEPEKPTAPDKPKAKPKDEPTAKEDTAVNKEGK